MHDSTVFYQPAFDITDTSVSLIVDAMSSNQHARPWLLWSHEYVPDLVNLARKIRDIRPCPDIIWMLPPSHHYSAEIIAELPGGLVRIDQDILRLGYYARSRSDRLSPRWNHAARDFLLLLGKPVRSTRLPLLWRLSQQGITDRCQWSLCMSEVEIQRARHLLPDLQDHEYHAFVSHHCRSLDNIQRLYFTDEAHYGGFPLDPDHYSYTRFRIVCETEMFDQPVITEKTWITMANHHPFLISGYHHNLDYLEQQGFRVFREYLPVPYYDQIPDTAQRLDAIVINARYWLDHSSDHHDDIQQDIQHNATRLRQYYLENLRRIKQLRQLLDPTRHWLEIFPFDIEQQRWMLFYQRIRDVSWPRCWFPEYFEHLPLRIQQECREVFGYQNIRDHDSDVIQ